jgi:Uma2 family endonuclease
MHMSTALPHSLLRIAYENAAAAYERSLPLEHYMEATAQGTQRKITLESLDLVHADRPEVQVFNELLVQYPVGRPALIEQVVPDNLVVIHPEPIRATGSYDVPFEPARPFWVLEYVSRHSQRKDYKESFQKYERHLKVPYALFFYPERQDLKLYRHRGGKYSLVKRNAAGRYPIRKLTLEVALLEGWVRFWYKGDLLPLPAELQRELVETRQQLEQALLQAHQAQEQAHQAQEQAHQAQEQAHHERQQKERLLAQLRELGIEPRL